MSVAYFGAEDLPASLDEIPLEYFSRAILMFGSKVAAAADGVVLFGSSKGAEAALAFATQSTDVRAVVAYAPSSLAWSCICGDASHASWTRGGVPVASVAPGGDPAYRPPPGFPLRPAINYAFRMSDSLAVDPARIQVEKIAGPLFLVAGDEEQLWPSLRMAQQIAARRTQRRVGARDMLLHYPAAGHLIGKAYIPAGATFVGAGVRLETGGSAPGNAAAQADAWPRVLAFIKDVFALRGK